MTFFRLSLFFCLAVSTLLTGCDCRKRGGDTISVLTAEQGAGIDPAQRQQEIFNLEIERLGSLEDAPCLPETPGGEKLVQSTDRLNKWIQDRKPDETWKPDDEFLAMERALNRTVETMRQTLRLLHLLQGKEVLDEQGAPIKESETLEVERKKISELLGTLESELNGLSDTQGIGSPPGVLEQIVELRKRFDSLDTIKNLTPGRIRSLAKQLEAQTNLVAAFSDRWDRLASAFRTEGLFFHYPDVEYLKQTIWLRNIAGWACGDKQDPLERARNLFDWTVCNIDLNLAPFGGAPTEHPGLLKKYPWQALLLGYGTIWDRAWIFVELLRQQRIDACLLSSPHPDHPDIPFIWAVGVLHDGQVYLFLPLFGVPMPGPGGPKTAENGSLDGAEIATLSQVLKDDSLLRRLDLSEDNRFPVTMEMLKNTMALLLGTPESVSQRMKTLEAELIGEQSMVLFSDVRELRRRFSEAEGVSSVGLWKYPFQTKADQEFIAQMTNQLMIPFTIPNRKRGDFPLWAGRILYFKGIVAGQESAMTSYQSARVPDREIMEYRNDPRFRNNPTEEIAYRMITANASFWLGLASFEIDSLPAAKDFFQTLEADRSPLWRGATEYMLGRIAEREKRYDEAIRRFERAAEGPAADGNRLRAKWLRELHSK